MWPPSCILTESVKIPATLPEEMKALSAGLRIYCTSIHNKHQLRMKRLLLGVIAVFCSTLAYSQATEIVVETYAENIGMVGTSDLTGYNTYRVYAKFSSPEDYLSAVFGDVTNPTEINGGTNFFQSGFGGLTNEDYKDEFFGFAPDLEYDSFVTIGMDAPAVDSLGQSGISTVGDPSASWIPLFEPGGGVDGSNLVINTVTGGAWFSLYPDSNAFAGEDSLILIGQFTTDGPLSGLISTSTFAGGIQDMEVIVTLPFSSEQNAIFGCTDSTAVNFDSNATDDDGSCVFECDNPTYQLVITSVSTIPVSCSGYDNGQVMVSHSGGQGAVSYSDGQSSNSIGVFNDVAAGNVTITITDDANCSVDTTLSVASPEELEITAFVSDPISCDGAADAVLSGSVTGGTGSVSFSLTAPIDTGSGFFFEMPSAELLFDGVGPGLYTVYAMDANGCVKNTPGISVINPFPLNVYLVDDAMTSCPESLDGVIVLNYTGGSGNATMFSIDGVNFFQDNVFDAPPGTYNIYAQDVNNCIDSVVGGAVVTTPDAFESIEQIVSPSCFGSMDGTVDVQVQGGTAPYTFVIEGDTAAVVMETMVGAGDFDIEVIDANGCIYDASVMVTQPDEIAIEATVTDVVCNGDENGTVTLSASGGTGMGFVYDFDGAGLGPLSEFTGLAAGSYAVTAQDDSGCSNGASVTVGSPEAISVTVDANDGATGEEADGTIDITVSGGTAPYSYSWEGPGYSSDAEDATGVAAGEYTVTITDTLGCEFESTTIVVVSGLEEVMNLIDVTLFPNPTRGLVELQLKGLVGESVTTVLTDGLGREVARRDLGNLSGVHVERMDLGSFESGVYFLRLVVADATEVIRVVKQ